MLGPRLLASQTSELVWLYDAARGEVQGLPWPCLALYFLWLKACFSSLRGVKQWPKVTVSPLRKFTSKCPNAFLHGRCLLSISVPSFFPWEL